MSIAFTCACGKKIRAKDEWAGKTVRCPGCGNPAKIPRTSEDPPSQVSKPGSKSGVVRPGSKGTSKTARKPAPARSASAPAPASDDIDLLPVDPPKQSAIDPIATSGEMLPEEHVQSLTATTKPCPFCKKPVFEGDPICINCGTDLKTGKKIEKKRERRPLGPYIKIGVLVLLVVGGVIAFLKYKKSQEQQAGGGGAQVADKTLPAREALRDGNADDFKTFASRLSGLTIDQVIEILRTESTRSESNDAAQLKSQMVAALLAWYGFSNEETVELMKSRLMGTTDDALRATFLEGLYAAGTPPDRRFIPTPARFDGLSKDLAWLPKAEPSKEALHHIFEKADDAAWVDIQLEAIQFSVVSGAPDKASRLVDLPNRWADRKPDILKTMHQVTAHSFPDEAAFGQWWANEGGTRNPKQWVVGSLAPESHPEDMRAAIRILSFLTGAEVAKITGKSTDEEVKAAAAAWKEWCEKNPDKLE